MLCLQNYEAIVEITAIISIIATLIVMKKQSSDLQRQMKLTLFSEYTARYQQLLLQLPLDFFSSTFSNKDLKIPEDVEKVFWTYVDLCSEEYYLHKTKNLDKIVWDEWLIGIRYNLSLGHTKRLIQERLDSYGVMVNF